jgi:chitodextrinase
MWETDEPADSTAEYGLDVNYGSSATNSSFTQSHTIILKDLRPLTVYHFLVHSADRAGNPSSSMDLSFTTSGAPDTIPPQLADIQVRGISDSLAVITWNTNEDADSLVEYGTGSNYGLKKTENGFVRAHCIVLRGLSPTTTYHFRVGSKDASGNWPTFSADHSFRTTAIADKSPPIVSNVRVAGITDRLAVVSWQTDELADGTAMFGPTVDYGRLAFHIELRMTHQLVLTGLSSSTTYHFRVGSTDASGNGPALSDDTTFQTGSTPDLKAPVLTNIRVENVTKTSAVITWETDELSGSLVEYGASKSYGFSTPVEGLTTRHSVMLAGLFPGKLYHFRVRSTDPSGNNGSSDDFKFTTAQNTPPANGIMNGPFFFGTLMTVIMAMIAVVAAFRLKSRRRKRHG